MLVALGPKLFAVDVIWLVLRLCPTLRKTQAVLLLSPNVLVLKLTKYFIKLSITFLQCRFDDGTKSGDVREVTGHISCLKLYTCRLSVDKEPSAIDK